ncbi:MAG: HEAT repeat domain-containing protein, partial [Planctomycetes bacterium]|nr:HEAT repeat domain-containing protein [Planctomycetota bacterium]
SGHADSKIRIEAITTIGRLEQEKAVLILTELLGHKKAAVVSLAITTAGELGYAEVVPGIIELLEKTRNKKFLKECCASLGKIGDVRAIPALANILRRKKFLGLFGGYADEIRGTATWALGHFNDASSRQYLEEALNDKSPVVRSAAKLGLKNSR